MEFKEFTNPLEADYDICSAREEVEPPQNNENQYVEELIGLIGILEDFSEEDLFLTYGITLAEYYRPTKETITKVKRKLQPEEASKKL